MLLICATGGLDLVEPQKEPEKSEIGTCCLIHAPFFQKKEKGHLNIKSILRTERFSKEFLDLLCKCL